MNETYTPATELDVYERAEKLAAYLKAMVEHADSRTFPSDEYLSEIERFIAETPA